MPSFGDKDKDNRDGWWWVDAERSVAWLTADSWRPGTPAADDQVYKQRRWRLKDKVNVRRPIDVAAIATKGEGRVRKAKNSKHIWAAPRLYCHSICPPASAAVPHLSSSSLLAFPAAISECQSCWPVLPGGCSPAAGSWYKRQRDWWWCWWSSKNELLT